MLSKKVQEFGVLYFKSEYFNEYLTFGENKLNFNYTKESPKNIFL